MVVLVGQVVHRRTVAQVVQHRHLDKEMLAQVLAVCMVHQVVAAAHRLQVLMS